MHDFVPEQRHEERAERDNQNASPARDVVVNSIDQLRAHDDIDTAPADASQDVEESDELYAVPAKPEPREYHLSQTEDGTEAGEVAHRRYTKEVEEDNDQS